MKQLLLTIAATLLAGCAAQEEQTEPSTQDINQSIRDFIELRELEPQTQIRTHQQDGWQEISEYFILYKARRTTYLVEFVRRCYELRELSRITPDVRWESNVIRVKSDTIRGCRIGGIWVLSEAEVAEIENIGEPPGSRN